MTIFSKKLMFNLQRLQVIVVLGIFFILGWFIFTYRILDVPPGINGDEAVIGYNAALVARNGYDSHGRFLPLFTAATGSNDWKQPVTFYAEVLIFRLFSPSYFALRAVSVIFVLVGGGVIFLLAYELLGFKSAIFSLFIFFTIPIVMIQSHLALENIAPVPFIAFWLWMVVKYGKAKKNKYLILAAATLSSSVYSYLGLRLIMPTLVALTISFVYYLNKKSPKRAIYKSLIFLLAVIPLLTVFLLVKKEYPDSFFGQFRPYQITSYQQLILPYISSFDLSFLFIKGDSTPYHSTGRQGVFLLATMPLFGLGIFSIARKQSPILIFILLTFFLTPLLYGLASPIHRGSRLLVLIPPYTIITSLGLLFLLNIKNHKIRSLALLTAVLMIILNYIDFVRDYWYEYPKRVKSEFAKPYQLVFEKAFNLSKVQKLTPFIQSDFRQSNMVAVDFFEKAYFPDRLKLWDSNKPIPKNSVIIALDYILSQRKDIAQEIVGSGDFGILINSEGRQR